MTKTERLAYLFQRERADKLLGMFERAAQLRDQAQGKTQELAREHARVTCALRDLIRAWDADIRIMGRCEIRPSALFEAEGYVSRAELVQWKTPWAPFLASPTRSRTELAAFDDKPHPWLAAKVSDHIACLRVGCVNDREPWMDGPLCQACQNDLNASAEERRRQDAAILATGVSPATLLQAEEAYERVQRGKTPALQLPDLYAPDRVKRGMQRAHQLAKEGAAAVLRTHDAEATAAMSHVQPDHVPDWVAKRMLDYNPPLTITPALLELLTQGKAGQADVSNSTHAGVGEGAAVVTDAAMTTWQTTVMFGIIVAAGCAAWLLALYIAQR